MNTTNQRLLKGIKIFFKVIYIITIIALIINVFSHAMFLFSGKVDTGMIPAMFTLDNPNIDAKLGGVGFKNLTGYGMAIVSGLPFSLKLVNSVSILLVVVIYLIILRVIKSVLKTVDQNQLFTSLNAKRLRNIGLLLLLVFLFDNGLVIINSTILLNSSGEGAAGMIGGLAGMATSQFAGIVFVFFIAAIFKIGVSMQEENQSFV